jgi:hypothetical protein
MSVQWTVLQYLPKRGHTTLSVWFLLLRRQLHTRLAPRASAGRSTGVLTVRGTPGQFGEIESSIQIPISHQTTPLTVEGPI